MDKYVCPLQHPLVTAPEKAFFFSVPIFMKKPSKAYESVP